MQRTQNPCDQSRHHHLIASATKTERLSGRTIVAECKRHITSRTSSELRRLLCLGGDLRLAASGRLRSGGLARHDEVSRAIGGILGRAYTRIRKIWSCTASWCVHPVLYHSAGPHFRIQVTIRIYPSTCTATFSELSPNSSIGCTPHGIIITQYRNLPRGEERAALNA